MPEPAERIHPEQDYADKIAERWMLPHEHENIEDRIAERRVVLASLIRSTLREEAEEGFRVAGVVYVGQEREANTAARVLADVEPAANNTVRRVLVLPLGDCNERS